MNAYCLKWHVTKSGAFNKMLVGPLAPYLDINLVPWDGHSKLPDEPAIFCQRPPLRNLMDKAAWLPMWDHARHYPQSWWNRLSKGLRVVAFSDAVYERATGAGLETLRITYYEDPSKYEPVRWDERVLMYWNRVGLVKKEQLLRMCEELRVDRLIFLSNLDPRIPVGQAYELPHKMRNTVIESHDSFLPREQYMSLLARANIFIAPRLYEGVGMTFLEAMAQGSAVFAHNAPTMNEYIDHEETGWFLGDEDWLGADLNYMGDMARGSCWRGHGEWEARIPEYAEFIL